MKVLITGGAGFVGSILARAFSKDGHEVTCLDNLMRRGSENNLQIFKENGINFVHGDIRNIEDFEALEGNFDLFVEASAEPSVHAGAQGSPSFVINNNLVGAINCLEYARKNCGSTVFLSSSRVYSIPPLKKIELKSEGDRFVHNLNTPLNGLTEKGISEDFSVGEFRSFYGTTKLAAELLIQEYCALYGMKAVSNRCGVLCGEGQWGKTDQGVFTLWVARHFFEGKLSYTGFGGLGDQVRDILHPLDLYSLIIAQISKPECLDGRVYNVGGGLEGSVSLLEYTKLCQEVTGKKIEIPGIKETAAVDIPFYVTDNSKIEEEFSWKVEYDPKKIVTRIFNWLRDNETELRPLF